MISSKRKRVLIVDDSALMRTLLTRILDSSDDLEVVGVARDPYVAWEKVQKLQPDVLTLDVEMPRMDGIEFLRKLMIARPTPVIMISSLTEANCETTLKALELGAIDFVAKPKLDLQSGTMELAEQIIEKVSVASRAKTRLLHRTTEILSRQAIGHESNTELIAIGGSTGGTNAIHDILAAMPRDAPGFVVVQHMPAGFTRRFAERLDSVSHLHVREARDGDRIEAGTALIAPGGRHMEVIRSGGSLETRLHDKPPVNRFRPSVDVLFESIASTVKNSAIGVILTGMGSDGANGIKSMREAGAMTIAQDEASCVVFGMPKAAIESGGICCVCPLVKIPKLLIRENRNREIRNSEECHGSA